MAPESTNASYTPGPWVAVGAESGWLLVDIDPSDPIVLQCWSLIRGGAEIDEVLDAVLQRGLRAVSSFALVRVAGDGRRAVVVRGAARAAITVEGADQSVSAEGVSTWRELELPPGSSAVRVSAGDNGAGGDEAPLSPGVTLASSIRLMVGAASGALPGPTAPSSAAPAPEPPAAPLVAPAPPAMPPLAESPPLAAPTPPPQVAPPSEPISTAAPVEPMPSDEPPPAPEGSGRVNSDNSAAPAPPIPWLDPSAISEPAPPSPLPPPLPAPQAPQGPEATPFQALPELPPMPGGPGGLVPDLPGPPPAPAQSLSEPGSEPDSDSMSWLSAVKPLQPAADDPSSGRGAAPVEAPIPGVVVGGRGIGRDGPPAQQSPPNGPANGQAWAPAAPREPESPDSTVSRASLGMLDQPGPSGSMVQAVRCQHGHLSPPMAVSCRVCGFPLMGQAPISVPRPTLGVLRLSTGDVVPLDRSVIMGRNPRVDDAIDAERPHIVRLPSPGHDISRTHVEIRLDGWHVLLTDLNSVNGTIVTPPWQEPQRLRANESVPIEPGTVVSLADEVTFRYEVTG